MGEVVAASSDTEDVSILEEATGLLEEIGDCVTRLFRVTSLVRQAGPTDLFAKALSRSRYHFSDHYDIAHVGEKYPKLATTENTWLQTRLGRAITQRRRYLSYIHDHHEKLEGKRQHDQHEPQPQIVTEEPQSLLEMQSTAVPQHDSYSKPSTFITKASSLVPGQITPQMLIAEDESDAASDAISYTTISRSVAGDLDSSAVTKIPKLDDLRTGTRKEFECPYCYRVKKFKNERVWRQHVFSDLRSYVCTFPTCNSPYFSDMNDWFRHELQNHRVEYRCHICNDKNFELGELYIAHVREEHPNILDDVEEQQVLDMARRPLRQIRAQDCPCCSEWVDRLIEREECTIHLPDTSGYTIFVEPAVFKRHLASHLEQLALFAVPTGSAAGEIDSNAAIEEDSRDKRPDSDLSRLAFSEHASSRHSSMGSRSDNRAREKNDEENWRDATTHPQSPSPPGTPMLGNDKPDSLPMRPIGSFGGQVSEHDAQSRATGDRPDPNRPIRPDPPISESDDASRTHHHQTTSQVGDNTKERFSQHEEEDRHKRSTDDLSEPLEQLGGATAAEMLSSQELDTAIDAVRQELVAMSLDHQDYANRLDDLASKLLQRFKKGHSQEDLQDAIVVAARARDVTAESSPEYVRRCNRLGVLLRDQGDYNAAAELFELAIERCDGTSDSDWALTLENMRQLGAYYETRAAFARAERVYRKILAGHEKMLGRELSASILRDEYRLALMLYNQHLLVEAGDLSHRLEEQMKTHPDLDSEGAKNIETLVQNISLAKSFPKTPDLPPPGYTGPSATDRVPKILTLYFSDGIDRSRNYTEYEIFDISQLLRKINLDWSELPRTYIVLRHIGCVDYFDGFMRPELSDYDFPYDEHRLQGRLPPTARWDFRTAQKLIETDALYIEKGPSGQHCHFEEVKTIPFEVEKTLGTGPAGQIYAVRSKISFRKYALKQLIRINDQETSSLESNEVELIAALGSLRGLNHMHLRTLIGTYSASGSIGLIMSPIAETNLSAYLASYDSSKTIKLRTFFGCLAAALEFLHTKGILHQNIKPKNILLHGDKIIFTDIAMKSNPLNISISKADIAKNAKYQEPNSGGKAGDIWSLGMVFLDMFAALTGEGVQDIRDHVPVGPDSGVGRKDAGTETSPPRDTSADAVVLDWIQGMLVLALGMRVTAMSILVQIGTHADENGHRLYIGNCCRSQMEKVAQGNERKVVYEGTRRKERKEEEPEPEQVEQEHDKETSSQNLREGGQEAGGQAEDDQEEGRGIHTEQNQLEPDELYYRWGPPAFQKGDEVKMMVSPDNRTIMEAYFTVTAARNFSAAWHYQLETAFGPWEDGEWFPENEIFKPAPRSRGERR